MNVEPSETYKTLQGGDYIAIHTYLFNVLMFPDCFLVQKTVIGILKNIA